MYPPFRKWLAAAALALASPAFGATGSVVEMTIDGTIHIGTVSMIEAGIARAKETKAEALLITLDTPGGLLDSTREIVKLFLNTDMPIIVYVGPRGAHAGSAGTFITMAAHVAAMAPGTNIGAAHPIAATGADPEKDGGKHLARKVENDTSAFIETIARQRGRNIEWGKKAVVESEAISETEALKLNVIDFVAGSKEELLAQADGRKIKLPATEKVLRTKGATIVPLEVSFGTRMKNWLANPTVMFVLLLIAGAGFYVEMSHPGLIFPAVAAGLAALLLMIATSLLPMSVVGLGLIALGFGLLIAEIYVTSFGLLAAGGIVSFVIGAYLLFDPGKSDIQVPAGMIAGSALGLASIAVLIGVAVSRTMGLKQLTGKEGLIGATGEVDVEIFPDRPGKIFVNGEYWNAMADEPLERGQSVEILEINGLVAQVRRVAARSA